jgi:sugar lactone lactonase YvrE
MKFQARSLSGSVVAGTGVYGTSVATLGKPAELVLDAGSNIYVNDDLNYRIMLWRRNASAGVLVAGNGSSGTALNTFGYSVGLAVDSQKNIYVSDQSYHRVMKWAVNASSGTIVVGTTGVSGSSNALLNTPYGLYLDEANSYLYIVDQGNSRIQRYRLNDTANGTTVAGGNGQGSSSNKFNRPSSICVSKKTGDMYIADTNNHRIQRWSPGATNGMTIIGVTGVNGTNMTLLNSPSYVTLSMNETFLYVSDKNNNRVQRFQLP